MKVCISGKTDVGYHRSVNEDAFSFCADLSAQNWNEEIIGYTTVNCDYGTMAIVADGMGGENAGEIASAIAVDSIRKDFVPSILSSVITSDENIKSFLSRTVNNASKAIAQKVETDPDTIGMGTTVVLLWIFNSLAYIAWCGDSRCYVFNPRNGLRCLSRDHSYVQELIDKGELKQEDSFNHPDSSVITRCLGDCDTSSEPDIVTYKISHYDNFLLCSDGLCGYSTDKQIEKTLYKHYADNKTASEELVKLALSTGGHDNVSVLTISTILDNDDNVPFGIIEKLRRYFKTL